MNEPKYVLETGTRIITSDLDASTRGMLVKSVHLNARRSNVRGEIVGIVGGHGGDVYWVRHDDDPTAPAAPYGWWEFELATPDDGSVVAP